MKKHILLLLSCFAVFLLSIPASAVNFSNYVDMSKSSNLSNLLGDWYELKSCYKYGESEEISCYYNSGNYILTEMITVSNDLVGVNSSGYKSYYDIANSNGLYSYTQYNKTWDLYITNYGLLLSVSGDNYKVYGRMSDLLGTAPVKQNANAGDFIGEFYGFTLKNVNGKLEKDEGDFRAAYNWSGSLFYMSVPYNDSSGYKTSHIASYDIRGGSMYAKTEVDGNTYQIDALQDGSLLIHVVNSTFGNLGNYVVVRNYTSFDQPFTSVNDPILGNNLSLSGTSQQQQTADNSNYFQSQQNSLDSSVFQLSSANKNNNTETLTPSEAFSGEWQYFGSIIVESLSTGFLDYYKNFSEATSSDYKIFSLENNELYIAIAERHGSSVSGNEYLVNNFSTYDINWTCDKEDVYFCFHYIKDSQTGSQIILLYIMPDSAPDITADFAVVAFPDDEKAYMFVKEKQSSQATSNKDILPYFQQEAYSAPVSNHPVTQPAPNTNIFDESTIEWISDESYFTSRDYIDAAHYGQWLYSGSVPSNLYDTTLSNIRDREDDDVKFVEVRKNGIYVLDAKGYQSGDQYYPKSGHEYIINDPNEWEMFDNNEYNVSYVSKSMQGPHVQLTFAKHTQGAGRIQFDVLLVVTEDNPDTILVFTREK